MFLNGKLLYKDPLEICLHKNCEPIPGHDTRKNVNLFGDRINCTKNVNLFGDRINCTNNVNPLWDGISKKNGNPFGDRINYTKNVNPYV